MRLLIAICLVAVVAGAPRTQVEYPSGEVQILRYENDDLGYGNYKFALEQSDGTKREEQGVIQNQGSENEFLSVKGYYEWVGPDGVTYIVTYTADEDGYKPEIQQGPGGAVSPQLASLLG